MSVLFPNLIGLQILWQEGSIFFKQAGGGGMKSACEKNKLEIKMAVR